MILRWGKVAGTAFLVPLLLLPTRAGAQTLPTVEDCVSCHLELDDDRLVDPVRTYGEDVHAAAGFGCLACHGGGGEHLDPAAGFLSAPLRSRIPEMCGRCHSDGAFMRQFNPQLRVDQVPEYWTSVHGQRLRDLDDPDVATCVDCHPAHRILPPSNPASTVYAANVPETCGRCHADPDHMAGRDVATDQVDKYYGSVHGKLLTEDEDLSAPVCNDCHGNHGAAPPGLTSVRNVCGQCHSVMGDYFDQSGHVEIFRENGLPGCATCHDHHAIQPVDEASLGDRSVEVCMRCHEEGDSAGSAFDTMAGVLDSLEWEVSEAEGILLDAEDRGMEVSQALFELEDVTNAQTHARSAIHTFKVDPVRTEAQAGFVITDRARDRGVAALAEYDFRRMGLGLAAGIILLLVMTLLFKIREADARIAELLAMIGGFFDTTMGASGGMPPTHEAMRLAACGILLEATYVDDSFSDEERGHLIELIRTRYGLVRSEADELIALVQAQRSGPVELGRLADLVSRHYSESERRALVKELWGLVYSDGVLTEREVSFMSQVAKLLHVGTEEVAATRREVEAG